MGVYLHVPLCVMLLVDVAFKAGRAARLLQCAPCRGVPVRITVSDVVAAAHWHCMNLKLCVATRITA
jgi:hypothetical protein